MRLRLIDDRLRTNNTVSSSRPGTRNRMDWFVKKI